MEKSSLKKQKKGFTLLIAVVTTSILLLVSFVVGNIALKQLMLAYSSQESQYSFYAADSGIECAIYWDLHYAGGTQSAFATSSPGSIRCNNQTVATGGGGSGSPTSTFTITLSKGCAIVSVTKFNNGDTTINSRGYNDSCSGGSSRRFERGIIVTY